MPPDAEMPRAVESIYDRVFCRRGRVNAIKWRKGEDSVPLHGSLKVFRRNFIDSALPARGAEMENDKLVCCRSMCDEIHAILEELPDMALNMRMSID